jgi:hypothetical protein
MSLVLALLLAGPISKWNDERPRIQVISKAPMFDIERCLIDLEGSPAPQVYRQPDRPDEVTLLWVVENTTVGRADLKRIAGGTEVKIWAKGNQMRACASTGRPTGN